MPRIVQVIFPNGRNALVNIEVANINDKDAIENKIIASFTKSKNHSPIHNEYLKQFMMFTDFTVELFEGDKYSVVLKKNSGGKRKTHRSKKRVFRHKTHRGKKRVSHY